MERKQKQQERKQLKLSEILYYIGIEKDASYIRDLERDLEVKTIVANASKRSRCKRSILFDLLDEYTLQQYVYSEMFTSERFLNEIKKYLGRKGRLVDYEDEVK